MFFNRKKDNVDLLHKVAVVCVADRFGFLFDTSKSKKRIGRLSSFDKYIQGELNRAYNQQNNAQFVQEVNTRYNNLFKQE